MSTSSPVPSSIPPRHNDDGEDNRNDKNDHINNRNRSPIFEGTSSNDDPPRTLIISLAGCDPNASLGIRLANHDNGLTNEMFLPGYASVGRILPDDDDDDDVDVDAAHGGTTATTASTSTTSTSLARRCGARVGDIIVAVNGLGYRRFPPDYDDATKLVDVTLGRDPIAPDDDDDHDDEGGGGGEDDGGRSTEESHAKDVGGDRGVRDEIDGREVDWARVISSARPGESYDKLLLGIRNIKTAYSTSSSSSSGPLVLSLERYEWDSRVHSWSRFLSARGGNVPHAMSAIQRHERWRAEFFPIDLTSPSLQRLFRSGAVGVIDRRVVGAGDEGGNNDRHDDHDHDHDDEEEEDGVKAPVVYIDFRTLQKLGADQSDTLSDDVVRAFVVYTETLLSKSPDPRSPKSSQFVDLTGVSIRGGGFRPGTIRKLYETFEPNYPETLERMVIYPVPKLLVKAVNAMLSFINEHTREKFVITDDLDVVCKELGWNINEIEECGGVNGYMNRHMHRGSSFVFD
ncbi:hypothetical protein ACHAXA_000759 [Cyclostephanos tholiformis]|uniref:CRAL-TRIO domain-containing protein n=1 Tax=Cyclostephanos tholiformis TaxID=382380 RepID=A0ABD3RR00_9STRA